MQCSGVQFCASCRVAHQEVPRPSAAACATTFPPALVLPNRRELWMRFPSVPPSWARCRRCWWGPRRGAGCARRWTCHLAAQGTPIGACGVQPRSCRNSTTAGWAWQCSNSCVCLLLAAACCLCPLCPVLVCRRAGVRSVSLQAQPTHALHPAACRRFVCREALGEGGREAAAYLRPVPPGAVVYGSGDSSVIVTKARLVAILLSGATAAHIGSAFAIPFAFNPVPVTLLVWCRSRLLRCTA